MQNLNVEAVKEKLFSTKSAGEKFDYEIENQANKIKEEGMIRLCPSQFAGQDEPLDDENYQKISELADFITQYVQ